MAEPEAAPPSILFVGDVVGGLGRRTLLDCLPVLYERHAPTFVVVNGENAAGGLGITPKIADQMFAAGVDVHDARENEAVELRTQGADVGGELGRRHY